MNSMSFLINTLFDLYIMVVILRIWLQAARADFYNPFSQFIVKVTQPVVGPLRRMIPSLGSIDLATVLFAYLLCVLVLLIRAILSWVSQGRSPIEYVFHQLTEPMLAPIRRILPAMGGFDFSVLVLFIALQFANFLIGDLIGPIWYQL